METAAKDSCFDTKAQQLFGTLLSGPKFPHHPFLVEGLTFDQLYCQMESIRIQTLQEMDKTNPICLCTENRGHLTAALLATLSGGPALLLPYADTAETLNEARQCIHYTHALMEKESILPAGVTKLAWPEKLGRWHRPDKPEPIDWDTPWVYLFTGGSTGTPLIWSKTPRNLLMEAAYLTKTYQISSSDIILATVPSNHIYGLLYSILLPLVSGASVSVFTPSFPNEIVQRLKETRATVLVSIPAHYRALKETPVDGHHVRLAFSSAGALAEQDGLDFYGTTGIAITEIYGSTETGGIAQRRRADGQTALHPFSCVDVRIQNEHLWVRSKFLSHELETNAEGFFETADRADWAERSAFSILGRSDGIVKVGGKRVDLAQTRETLMRVEGVRDAYVFALPVQSGRENEVVALVEGPVHADQIMQAANSQLPSYARPRVVKVTQQMPVSPTGKYNREAIIRFFKPDA